MWGWLIIIGFVVFVLFTTAVFFGAPYLPTRKRDAKWALEEIYSLGPSDLLVDIGSGDGIILRLAAESGARALGYEINPILVLISMWLCRRDSKTTVKWANFWHQNLPDDTTIVYTFGEARDIEKMAAWVDRQAMRLNRPLYFLSYGFKLERPVLRSKGAFNLYEMQPLQPSEA